MQILKAKRKDFSCFEQNLVFIEYYQYSILLDQSLSFLSVIQLQLTQFFFISSAIFGHAELLFNQFCTKIRVHNVTFT